MTDQESSGEDSHSDLSQYETMIETMSGINYIIDRDYNIALYSKEKWDEFARSNDGKELTNHKNVKGKSVLDNFAGKKVKDYYRRMYDLIFEGLKKEILIKSKCDAPESLRDNVLFLNPVYKDVKNKEEVIGILHQSLILKVDERPQVPLLKKKQEEVGNFLEMCSICKSVKYEVNSVIEWISAENYYKLGGSDEINLEHSICDDCGIMLDEFL